MTPLLDTAELCRRFPAGRRGWFTRAPGPQVHAVQDVTSSLMKGEARCVELDLHLRGKRIVGRRGSPRDGGEQG